MAIVVGRIMKAAAAPEGTPWLWTGLINVRFGPLCGLKSDIVTCPKSADCVAEVCGYSSEAAASISRDGSHHPLFAER
jgi:hypothetical protein